MLPWAEFQAVLFERGIALDKEKDHEWQYRSSVAPLNIASPNNVFVSVGVRPIVVVLPSVDLVIPTTKGRFLDIYRSELVTDVSRSLLYMMGAALYHCKRLAWWYANESARVAKMPLDVRHKSIVLGGTEEPYFEFEALVTVIVRCFDTLRYSLWRLWGNRGSCPSSYERVVDALINCPDVIMSQLAHNRENVYLKAKSYRDCIQHYCDFGSTSWSMAELLHGNIWSVIVRIPDNPEVRSDRQFKFDQNIDSLTFGWELCNQMFALIDSVLGSGSLSMQTDGRADRA